MEPIAYTNSLNEGLNMEVLKTSPGYTNSLNSDLSPVTIPEEKPKTRGFFATVFGEPLKRLIDNPVGRFVGETTGITDVVEPIDKTFKALSDAKKANTAFKEGDTELARLYADRFHKQAIELDELTTTSRAVGAGLKLGSFFVPATRLGLAGKAGTTALIGSRAISGGAYSIGSQLKEDELSATRTLFETGTAIATPELLKGLTKFVVMPVAEKLSGLTDDTLSELFKAAKANDAIGVEAFLRKNKLSDTDYLKTVNIFRTQFGQKPLEPLETLPNTWAELVKGIARESVDFSDFRGVMTTALKVGNFIPTLPQTITLPLTLASSKIFNVKTAINMGRLSNQIDKIDNSLLRNSVRNSFIKVLGDLNVIEQ